MDATYIAEAQVAITTAHTAVLTEGNVADWPTELKAAVHHIEEARVILRDYAHAKKQRAKEAR